MRLGIDKHATLLAVFLVFAASAGGQTGKNYKFHVDANVQNSEVVVGNQSITINYSLPELNIEGITNSWGKFYRISVPGHISSAVAGKPELPVFSRIISIPEGSGWKIKIYDVKSTRIKPFGRKADGILYPAQESESKQPGRPKPVFKIDKDIYATKGLIPTDTVTIESLGTVRNNKLSNLFITPVRYDPRSNNLEVITSMRIEITFSNSVILSSKNITGQSKLFGESLDKGVLNFNPGEVIPGYTDQPVKMIILTDTAFKKQLEPFIRWKTQKGFKLTILYKGTDFAGNDYTQIKQTLTQIYKSPSSAIAPPEYLLIIGDVKRVPYFGAGGSGNITDMYYGEFDGNGDYIPEMFIGRLPVADTAELSTALGKIIQYEKFQYADTNQFYSRALVTAGFDEGYSGFMNGQIKYLTSNYLTPANRISEYHFNYPQSYTAKDSVLKLINKGLSFINYTGHGEADGWLHINIKSPDIQLLENKNMYPFIISNACNTAQFNLVNSFGNKMVVTRDKGAVGFIGCSNESYWDEDFYWAVGPGAISSNPTYEKSGLGAFDRMFHTHGESPSDWYSTMGQIFYAGNLAVSASTSPRKKYYWETYNLIGDPSVIPITGKPSAFSFSLPDTLPNGLRSLSLNVDPFSYVAISHFDTLWDATYASNSGTAVLDMPGLSNDSCLVVITGQNRYPMIKTVYFSDINKEFINLSASSINDSQGNNNGIADFGESFYLKLTLSNLGLTDANNLYAKISTASDWATITNDSVMIGTLAAKSEIVISDQLGLSIAENIPDLGIVTVALTIKDQYTEKHYSVDIGVHAPALQIINCIMDDNLVGNGDNIPDPGETFRLIFKIRNEGSSNISGQLSISCANQDISIVEPSVKSGILKFGQITDIPILVKLAESSSSGNLISVSALLDCTPYVVNKDFSFRVGKIRESFEASSFNVFPWINISTVPWTLNTTSYYDGLISARSGKITNDGTSSLIIKPIYLKEDSVKFFYKVSSEPNYDYLSFKINDVEIFRKSGEIPWTKKVVAVQQGLNKLEWTYKKDGSQSAGSDCAWIDMIDFSQLSPINYIKKDLQVARIVNPVLKDRFGQGTIAVKVLNTGKDTLNGFNLAYEVNNRITTVRESFKEKVIPYGDSVTVTFKTKADLSKLGMYEIKTYGYDNNDDYHLNDTLKMEINNTEISDSLIVYPNPFDNQFTIFVNSRMSDRLTISINSISGVSFYKVEKDIISGKNSISISNLHFAPGLYYLRLQGTGSEKTIPLLKVIK